MHLDFLPFSLEDIFRTFGYLGVFAIVFAESGLLIGIMLPGDSLLFTAGFLASEGRFFNIWVLIIGCIIAAISGDAVGYAFGRSVGRRLYDRPDSRWFKQRHLRAAEAFYAKHGGRTIVLARFIPIVRTLAPIVAGASNMTYRRFATFNVLGGVLWGGGVTLAGYLLGSAIPSVDRYLLPIIALIVLISALPSIIHLAVAHREEILARLPGGAARQARHVVAEEPADPPPVRR